jgi:hypothetical protein
MDQLHSEMEHAKEIAPMSFTNSLCISLDFQWIGQIYNGKSG